MTYFLIILSLLAFVIIYQLYKLYDIKRHDKVLFSFRELKTESILFLADNHETDTLTTQDKNSIRHMVGGLQIVISNFHNAKKLFDPKFIKFVYDVKEISKDINKMELSKNRDVLVLQSKMGKNIMQGFYCYSPLLRFKVAYLLAKIIVKILVLIGIKKMKGLESAIGQILLLDKKYGHSNEDSLPC